MRALGSFFFGFLLALLVLGTLSYAVVGQMAGQTGSSPSGDYGAVVWLLFLVGATIVGAAVVGLVCAAKFRNSIASWSGYAMALGSVVYLLVSARSHGEAEARRAAEWARHDAEVQRREAPQKNAEFRAQAEHRRAARSEIPALLGDWMPADGKIDVERAHRDGQGVWATILIRTSREKAEDLISRIAPDGWSETSDLRSTTWHHAPIPRPGDGVEVNVEVGRTGPHDVWLYLERPGFSNYG